MKKLGLLVIAIGCLFFSFYSHAAFIVDTGAGQSSIGGPAVGSDQSLAGKFTLTYSHNIKSVEGWFGTVGGIDFTLTAAIYTDGGLGIPIIELFSQQFLLDNPESGTNAWDGAYGLNWALPAGTYWLVFGRPGDFAEAWLPSGIIGAPNPLDDYANFVHSDSFWTSEDSSAAYPMRISAVPVPAALWFFSSGLIGLLGLARFEKV